MLSTRDVARGQIETLAGAAEADKVGLAKVQAEIHALDSKIELWKRQPVSSHSSLSKTNEKEAAALETQLVHLRAVRMTALQECEQRKQAVNENRKSKLSITTSSRATREDLARTLEETQQTAGRVVVLQSQHDELSSQTASNDDETKRELLRLSEELKATSERLNTEQLRGINVKIASRESKQQQHPSKSPPSRQGTAMQAGLTASVSAPALPFITPQRPIAVTRKTQSDGKPPKAQLPHVTAVRPQTTVKKAPKTSTYMKTIAELAASGKQPSIGELRSVVLNAVLAQGRNAAASGRTESSSGSATSRDVLEAETALEDMTRMFEVALRATKLPSREALVEAFRKEREDISNAYYRLSALSAEAEQYRSRLADQWAQAAQEGQKSDVLGKERLAEITTLQARLAQAERETSAMKSDRNRLVELGKSLRGGLAHLLRVLSGETETATQALAGHGADREDADEAKAGNNNDDDDLASVFPRVEALMAATVSMYAKHVHNAQIPVALPPATLALALQHHQRERQRRAKEAGQRTHRQSQLSVLTDDAALSENATEREADAAAAADGGKTQPAGAGAPVAASGSKKPHPALSPLPIPAPVPLVSPQSRAKVQKKAPLSTVAAKSHAHFGSLNLKKPGPAGAVKGPSARVGVSANVVSPSAAKGGVKEGPQASIKTPTVSAASALTGSPTSIRASDASARPFSFAEDTTGGDGAHPNSTQPTRTAGEAASKQSLSPHAVKPLPLAALSTHVSQYGHSAPNTSSTAAAVEGSGKRAPFSVTPVHAANSGAAAIAAATGIMKQAPSSAKLLPPVLASKLSATALYSQAASPKGRLTFGNKKKESFLRGVSGRRGLGSMASASVLPVSSPIVEEVTPVLALEEILVGPSFAPMAVVAPPSSRLPEGDDGTSEGDTGVKGKPLAVPVTTSRKQVGKTELAPVSLSGTGRGLKQSTARLLAQLQDNADPLSLAASKKQEQQVEEKANISRPSSASSGASVPSLNSLNALASGRLRTGSRGLYASRPSSRSSVAIGGLAPIPVGSDEPRDNGQTDYQDQQPQSEAEEHKDGEGIPDINPAPRGQATTRSPPGLSDASFPASAPGGDSPQESPHADEAESKAQDEQSV